MKYLDTQVVGFTKIPKRKRVQASPTTLLLFFCIATCANAQDATPTADDVTAKATGTATEMGTAPVTVADKVQVDPVNGDDRIEKRLQEVFEATGWFTDITVKVDRGVAFLSGLADSEKHQVWAEATAMNTSDVVAVVNHLKVVDRPFWNFAPAVQSVKDLARETTSLLPLILVGFVIAVLGYYTAILTAMLARKFALRKISSQLLQEVAGNVAGVFIFIVFFYLALRISGLTRLALTLLGGTGLVGLALGFAFRDIAENYLASILISLNHPFRVGDLIEVGSVGSSGAKGYVRRVTMRGTILSTLEGNQIQLPNSTVYKGMVTNYMATPLSRLDFAVGIGFEDSISEAQDLIMKVLTEHDAVVNDPPPMVLVESLGSATVNLKCYYWFDLTKNSGLKIGSSIIRQVKQSLIRAKITMPDEARELVFPQGVPVTLVDADVSNKKSMEISRPPKPYPMSEGAEVNHGEDNLTNDQQDVMKATEGDETIANDANLIG